MIFKWEMKLNLPDCKGMECANLVVTFLAKFYLWKKKKKDELVT